MSRPKEDVRNKLRTTTLSMHTIKTKILHQLNGSRSKVSPARRSGCRLGKVRRVRPTTDRQQNLQLAVLLLQQEELLHAAIHISTDVVPGVGIIVLVSVGPSVTQINLSGIWVNIGKGIQHVSELRCRQILGIEVATIDSLQYA